MADQTDAPEGAPVQPAQAFLRGVFSLYHTPDGGVHLAFRAHDAPVAETEHVNIAPALIGLFTQINETGQLPGPTKVIGLLRTLMAQQQ